MSCKRSLRRTTAALAGAMTAVAMSGPVAAGAAVAHPDSVVCYAQRADDGDAGAVSQTFTDGESTFDSYGADDFVLTENCRLSAVIAVGRYFNGTGPADSETVTVYKNADGVPGKQIYSVTAAGADDDGTFTTKTPQGVQLRAGVHYWLSVSATMSFAEGGEWFWETTSERHGFAGLWENPNGGLNGNCTTWTKVQRCFGNSGVDYLFTLRGRVTG